MIGTKYSSCGPVKLRRHENAAAHKLGCMLYKRAHQVNLGVDVTNKSCASCTDSLSNSQFAAAITNGFDGSLGRIMKTCELDLFVTDLSGTNRLCYSDPELRLIHASTFFRYEANYFGVLRQLLKALDRTMRDG
jgi:hypothetical protein